MWGMGLPVGLWLWGPGRLLRILLRCACPRSSLKGLLWRDIGGRFLPVRRFDGYACGVGLSLLCYRSISFAPLRARILTAAMWLPTPDNALRAAPACSSKGSATRNAPADSGTSASASACQDRPLRRPA